MLVLFLPLLEHKLQFIESGKLTGLYHETPDTSFTLQGWWDGSYQPAKEKYINDQTGFRPDLVRLTCQLDFWLFDKNHAGWDIRGGNDCLFQWPYIDAYYGLDFQGYQHIRERAIKLKAIQDTLNSMGKTFILVYAASKATSYPEYFPSTHKRSNRGPTNHDTYRNICDSLGVNQIDMDEWFLSMKHTSREPLFSKQGIHWTQYGAVLANDSLVRYIERVRHINLPAPVWSDVEHTDKLRDGDDDLLGDLNLIFPYTRETLAYPILHDAPQDSTAKKINAILLGDSFAQKLKNVGSLSKITVQCEFWSYFNSAHDINSNAYSMMDKYDWQAALRRADCIILCYTTFNLKDLGNGFIEQAYNHYYPTGNAQK